MKYPIKLADVEKSGLEMTPKSVNLFIGRDKQSFFRYKKVEVIGV